MNSIRDLFGPMRPPFLVLTPACVLLGLGTARWTTGHIDWANFILALIGALAAHIGVNALNEYVDFRTGLDFITQRTPFSGGSGTLPQKPELAKTALWTGVISTVAVMAIGAYFWWLWGWKILPVGLLGILLVVLYTPWLARNPWLCLISPGTGFGLLMVMGTHFVLTGEYSWTAFWASLVPFFLVNNLLLLNQFPDVEADAQIGRKHLPIARGRRTAARVYVVFNLLAYLAIIIGVVQNWLPPLALLGLLTLVFAVPATQKALQHAEDLPKLMPALGMNVLVNILTPTLMAVGLLLS